MKIHSQLIFKERARELRNNPTPQEKMLWHYLKGKTLGYTFLRQHNIGPFIVDFYCAEKRLVIEVDGTIHENQKEYDNERTHFLGNFNYQVLRFWNHEIKDNITDVIKKIKEALEINE
jgi:leucyl-tRNA synthetase